MMCGNIFFFVLLSENKKMSEEEDPKTSLSSYLHRHLIQKEVGIHDDDDDDHE